MTNISETDINNTPKTEHYCPRWEGGLQVVVDEVGRTGRMPMEVPRHQHGNDHRDYNHVIGIGSRGLQVDNTGETSQSSRVESEFAGITNDFVNMPSAPTYADGEYDDDNIKMIEKLMKSHGDIVVCSLVERSNLIRSVKWLSRHVPGCVLRSLFDTILRARTIEEAKKAQKKSLQLRRACAEHKILVDENNILDNETMQVQLQQHDSDEMNDLTISFQSTATIEDVENILPVTEGHDGALLFVDISGFTRISVMMDVESLSNAINTYFQKIVNEITSHGGDVLKFAGDALFAEWKVGAHRNLDDCVTIAATCAGDIVDKYSEYPVLPKAIGYNTLSRRTQPIDRENSEPTRRGSVSSTISGGSNQKPFTQRLPASRRNSVSSTVSTDVTLSVKCAVGSGHIVSIHVGDDISRREYLILGDTIGQVARAESAASQGEVFASPEAVRCLMNSGTVLSGDWKEDLELGRPVKIADHGVRFFQVKCRNSISNVRDAETMLRSCDMLDASELHWLKRMISLYVHPVVVNYDNELEPTRRGSDQERHLAEAELRNVYTCFISLAVDYTLTGYFETDQKLFNLLNDIMILTTRELGKVQGHLRQYILDDKGLVLICTFGLRGSTFPNMITQRAVPFSLSIHRALEEDLGVKNTVGATFGKVYCGVVGGLDRHEFAVLGPSVNLAARLMISKINPGVLVDKNVRLLTSQLYFKPLPAVEAKGYDEAVAIYEPIKHAAENPLGQGKRKFIGRADEINQILQMAKEVLLGGPFSKMFFISALSGSGKSALISHTTELVREMIKKLNKRLIITRHVCNDGDSRIPFSMFRSLFRDLLSQMQQCDDESVSSRYSSSEQVDTNSDSIYDNLSVSSKGSTKSNNIAKFRSICKKIDAPPEIVETVGRRFLGLRETDKHNKTPNLKLLDLQKVVTFLADVFIRCTKDADLVLLSLDDVHWMDEMSWKVIDTIFKRGNNVLTLCGSRPTSSNPLTVDARFWSDLQGPQRELGRYSEFCLSPFTEAEVKELIAETLDFKPSEIDDSFSHNLFTTSAGMPHYLSYVLDNIKRSNHSVRLDTGMIGLKSSAEEENKMFGSLSELLLYRLDALDSSVRTVLNLSAVLGTEFDLLDAAFAYEEMFDVEESNQLKTATALREYFDVAIEAGIIEQSLALSDDNDDEEEDMFVGDDSHGQSMGSIISLKGLRRSHPLYAGNCRLRFTHDSWRTSILSVMLAERKQEMHEHVAVSMERALDDESHHKVDFEKQITVLKHWKSSWSFTKASLLALNIGGQLMILGLNSQAILLFDDAIDILKEMNGDEPAGISFGGISEEVLDAIYAIELENLIKLEVAKGKAYSTLGNHIAGALAYQSALDILNNSACAYDEEFDRSVSFPIFSGLFVVLKMGAIEDDAECSYEQDLCKKFVEQTRLNGDPVHYGRALAMEAETLGRLGHFEQALDVVERIKSIYNIETQHEAICKAYGSDRVAQAFSHSVNHNNALRRIDAALDTCNCIIDEIIPKSDPKNIHNMVCLLYTVLTTLAEKGFARRARDVFQARVLDPFEEYFGQGGTTFSKPIFKPMLVWLELESNVDQESSTIDEYTAWALDGENFEQKIAPSFETAWAAFSCSPIALHSNVCFALGKRQQNTELRMQLIQKAINLMEKSVANTGHFPTSNMYARKKLEVMQTYARHMAGP